MANLLLEKMKIPTIFAIVLAMHLLVQASAVDKDTERKAQVFKNLVTQLKNKVAGAKKAKNAAQPQFGILYIPQNGEVQTTAAAQLSPYPNKFETGTDWFPLGDNDDYNDIQSNYLITTPYPDNNNRDVHTEQQLLLDGAYRYMVSFLKTRPQSTWTTGRAAPAEVYLYTYNLPCVFCKAHIRSFRMKYRSVQLIVGYSSTEWNKRQGNNNADVIKETIKILNAELGPGNLIDVSAAASQASSSSKKGNRKKRSIVVQEVNN